MILSNLFKFLKFELNLRIDLNNSERKMKKNTVPIGLVHSGAWRSRLKWPSPLGPFCPRPRQGTTNPLSLSVVHRGRC
jgi:hypothetical protein